MVSLIVSQFLISILVASGSAFWWSSPTTTESTPVLKQIPVGYFRTYTYQPLSYSPRYPLFPPVPANPYSYDNVNPSWTQYNAPPPTIVPAKPPLPSPATQPTTTTTSTTAPQYQPPDTQQNYQPISAVNSQPLNNYPSIPPALDFQPGIQSPLQNLPTYQQLNPSPDLSAYQYFSGAVSQPVPQVQFVPCMCPVTVSVGARELLENRAAPDSEDFLQTDNGEASTLLND